MFYRLTIDGWYQKKLSWIQMRKEILQYMNKRDKKEKHMMHPA